MASESHVKSHRPGVLTPWQTQGNSVTRVWDLISHLFVNRYPESEAWHRQIKERQQGYRLRSVISLPVVINLLPWRRCLIRSTLRRHASVFERTLYICKENKIRNLWVRFNLQKECKLVLKAILAREINGAAHGNQVLQPITTVYTNKK